MLHLIERFDFAPLRQAACEQARLFLDRCYQEAPRETFYALAFCVDRDVHSLYCQAQSEESVEHPGDRFFINGWKYADDSAPAANAALSAVWAAYDKLRGRLTEGKADRLFAQVRRQALQAIRDGLQDFRGSGVLPKASVADFGLFVYDPDPDDAGEARKLARSLNSAKTFKAFADPDNGYPFA